jgi:tight adherence protein B
MNTTISPPTALVALLGVGVGLGLLLMLTGWRGVDPDRPPRALTRRALSWPTRRGPGDQRRMLRLAATIAVAVLTGVATGWIVGAVLAGLALWSLPGVLGRDRDHTRRVSRIEGIATWTEMLRDTLSAAAGLEQAILATAPLAPVSIRREITELAARLTHGERLVPCLRTVAEQLGDPTGDLVIASLVLAAEQHARHLGDLLGSLAHAARQQASMRMRVHASRARTRTSVRIIIGTTLAFAVTIVLLNRPYLSAYDSTTGQVILLGIGGLFGLGFAWLGRIATIAEPARFLSLAGDAPVQDSDVIPERQG